MISLSNLKLFPLRTKQIAFPNNEMPYNVIVYPENTSFIEAYPIIDIKRIYVKKILLIVSSVLKLFRNKKLSDTYKQMGLIPVYDINKISDNCFIDFGYILDAIEKKYGKDSFKRKNVIGRTLDMLYSYKQYEKYRKNVLLYIIDLNKPLSKQFFTRRIFPVLYDIKENKDFKLDYFLVSVIKDGQVVYFLLKNKDGILPYERIKSIIMQLRSEVEEKTETISDLNNAIEKIIESLKEKESLSKNEESKIKSSLINYLKARPALYNKIKKGEISSSDVYSIVSKSILKSATTADEKSIEEIDNIEDDKKREIFKKVTETLLQQIVEKDEPQNNNRSLVLKNVDIAGLNENKEPSHLINKRREDFSQYLYQDLIQAFKVLEKKDPPLKIKSIKTEDILPESGDLNPTLLTNYKIELVGEDKKIHEVNIQLPKIQKDGTFLINGKKKYLIYQILLDPIFFLKEGIAKLESNYAAISINLKQTRNKSYYIIHIGGRKLPLFSLMGYFFGFEETCKLFRMTYEIINEKDKYSKYLYKLSDDKYLSFDFDINKKSAYFLLETLNQLPIQLSSENFKDKSIYKKNMIEITKNRNCTYSIDEVLSNILDPITINILKSKFEPTELPNIILYICDELAKGRIDIRNDLNHQRIRSSEIFVQQIQKLIIGAHNHYSFKKLSGEKDIDYIVDTDHIVKEIINSKMVRGLENINPIEELSCLTRITPVGEGGIPDSNAMTMQARGIHSSYVGNIDSVDTPEGSFFVNTLVRINYKENEEIQNLYIGDKILWRDGKLYDIVNKKIHKKQKHIIKTKDGIINCSKEHKYPIYDKFDKQEKILTTGEIMKNIKRYQFIKYKEDK